MTSPEKQEKPKLREAKLITPPNTIKNKVGSGGLDTSVIAKANQAIENNTIDFRPIALELLKDLEQAIQDTRNVNLKGEEAIEAMLYPSAQFKAQGAIFHFPLVSEISDSLVNFLETVTSPMSEDAMEIVSAHKMAISVIISKNIMDKNHTQGRALKASLIEACERYYKARKN